MTSRTEVCIRHSKYSVLLHNIGGRILRDAIDHFCLQSVPDFKTFLNNKKHDLFHLWRNRCCSVHPVTSHGQPIGAFQWNILFQKTEKSCIVSSKGDCPCKYEARNVTTAVLDVTLAIIIIKNVCPGPLQTSTDVEVVREKKNTLVSHIVGAYMTEKAFNAAWCEVKPALCNIASCISKDKKDEIEKDTEKLEKESSSRSISLENTRVQMEEHIDDKTFQTPELAVTFGMEQLKEKGIIIYTGYGGSGKTKLALETMRIMKEESTKDMRYNLIVLDMIEHWNTVVDPTEQSIVLLDDCFGRVSAVRSVVEEKSKFFNTIYACIGTGNIKVIMTLRSSILTEVQSKLLESKLFKGIYQSIVIDLSTDKFTFTEEERYQMLRKHLKANSIEITQVKKAFYAENEPSIDQFTILDIARVKHPCYPLTAYLYCSQPRFLRLGVKYFYQPRESLRDDILEMRNSGEESVVWCYCTLVYMGLRDGMLDMNEIDRYLFELILKNFHTQIADGARLQLEISKAVKHLRLTYVVEPRENIFLFLHTSVLEAVTLSVGEFYPEMIIKNCCHLVLFEMLVPQNFTSRENELTLKINSNMYEEIAARFLREIEESLQSRPSLISDILLHRLFSDQKFSRHFIIYARYHLSSRIQTKMLVIRELFLTACRINRPDVVCMALDLNMKGTWIEQGLKDCCYYNNPEVVDILLQFLDPDAFEALTTISYGRCPEFDRNFTYKIHESPCHSIKDAFFQACSFGSYEAVGVILAHYQVIPQTFQCFEIPLKVIHHLRGILQECFVFKTEYVNSASVMSFLSKEVNYLRNELNCKRTWECECALTNAVDVYTEELLSTVHLPIHEASKRVWNSIANTITCLIITSIFRNKSFTEVGKLTTNKKFFNFVSSEILKYLKNGQFDTFHSCKTSSEKVISNSIAFSCRSGEEYSLCLGCSVIEIFEEALPTPTKSRIIMSLLQNLGSFVGVIDERHVSKIISRVGSFLKLTSKLCSAVRTYKKIEREYLTTTLKWMIRGCEMPDRTGPEMLNDILTKNPDTNFFQDRNDVISVKFSILKEGLVRCFKAEHVKIASLLVDTCLCFQTYRFLTPKTYRSAFGWILLESIDAGRYTLAYYFATKYKNMFTTIDKIDMIVEFCYANQKSMAENMFDLFDEFPTKDIANAVCNHMNCKLFIDIVFAIKPDIIKEKIVFRGTTFPEEMTVEELAVRRKDYNGKYLLDKVYGSSPVQDNPNISHDVSEAEWTEGLHLDLLYPHTFGSFNSNQIQDD